MLNIKIKLHALKPRHFLVFTVFLMHIFVFTTDVNFYPFLKYDLFARVDDFKNEKEAFLGRKSGSEIFDLDLTEQIRFGPKWRYLVTVKKLMREDPERLADILKLELREYNQKYKGSVQALRFVADRNGENKVFFEVNLD